MNKQELAIALTEKTQLTKAAAERLITVFTDTIGEALANGEKVQLIGFGTFETRERGARDARNPLTGETLKIAAKTVPAFKPGKALKEAVNK
jgi:DNA-binding protein HU-beta